MLTAGREALLADLVAARGPLLVTTDLDGTLAPIVDEPGDALVPEETLAVLERLAGRVRLAVITGRDLNTARRLVPCDGVTIIGSHGLEASFDHPLLPEIDRLHLAPALEGIEQRVISAVPAAYLHIERKAISTAFHFRSDPSLGPAIRAALLPLPDDLRLREGRMVYEVLPNSQGGKDRALLALSNHFKIHSLLCIGDDLTDVAMFRAALTLRDRGDHVLLVGISGGPETPPEIVALADLMLETTVEARELLESLARHVGV